MAMWVFEGLNRERIATEHGLLSRTQELQMREFLIVLSCSCAITVSVESCI